MYLHGLGGEKMHLVGGQLVGSRMPGERLLWVLCKVSKKPLTCASNGMINSLRARTVVEPNIG